MPGTADRPAILLSPPDLRGGEREAVLAAIDSGWIAPAGPDLDAFEEELAAACGTRHAVAVSSGTAGLRPLPRHPPPARGAGRRGH